MVKLQVDKQIVITGILSLAAICLSLIVTKQADNSLNTMVVGAIALAIGVVIPRPKIDNRRGILKW
jgi:Cu/Ag efflux pump CusA